MTAPRDPHQDGPTPGPFSALLGFRYTSVDQHEAVVEADPGPDHCNGGGIVHGGFLASQLSVQCVRAAVPGVPLVCRGRCVGVGRRIGSTDAEITQAGVVVARALGTHAVLASS